MPNSDKDFDDDFDLDDDDFMDEDFGDEDFDSADFGDSEIQSDSTRASLEEEDDFGEEFWDDLQEQSETEDDKSSQKASDKKGLNFNTIVILCALLAGFGVFVFQVFIPEKVETIPEDLPFQSTLRSEGQINNPVINPALDAKKEREERDKQNLGIGFLTDPDRIDTLGSDEGQAQSVDEGTVLLVPDTTDSGTSTPSATIQPQGQPLALPVPRLSQQQLPVPSPDDQDMTDLLPMPSLDNIPDNGFVNNDADQAMSGFEEPEEPARMEPTRTAPDRNASDPLASWRKALPQTPASNQQTEPSTDQNSVQAGVNDEQAQALLEAEAEIEKLEQDLITQQEKSAQDMSALRSELSDMRAELEKVKAALEDAKQQANTQANKPVATAPVAKKTGQESAKPKVTQNRAPQKPWELRAAMPGKAWIARQGQNEMTVVSVGDSVRGLGRVTSIQYQNNVWVVQGTNGSIRQ